MATKRDYYDMPDIDALDARVIALEPAGIGLEAIILDSTIFYPEGGGQPCDAGTIASIPVESAIERGEDVVHIVKAGEAELAAAGILVGATVRCAVDLDRRLGHREQHTAQHLLSAVVARLLGGTTLSFHLGERYSSIDLDLKSFTVDDAEAVEDEVISVIRGDYVVTTHLCPPEDASMFALRKEPTVEASVLRVVEIDGIDYSACCGTHARSTGELGSFRITKVEKYKGGYRIHFVAGARAYDDYRRLARIAREASAAAAVAEDEIAATLSACKERIKRLEKSLGDAILRAAAMEAANLDSSAPAGAVVFASAEGIEAASTLARALAGRGRICVVESLSDLKIAAASPQSATGGSAAMDIVAVLSPVAKDHGGKGGGGRAFFQAAFIDATALQEFLAAVRLA